MAQLPEDSPSLLSGEENSIFGVVDVYPKNFKFNTQNRSEKVYIKARAHPFTNIGWILRIAFLSVLPFIFYIIILALPFDLHLEEYISLYLLITLLLLYYSTLVTATLIYFVDWYYDIYIVTNQRLLNIQFDPLKKEKVSETRLSNIENVTESVIGLWPQLLDYGNVKVQTAARYDWFEFKAVPKPTWFRDIVMDLARFFKSDT